MDAKRTEQHAYREMTKALAFRDAGVEIAEIASRLNAPTQVVKLWIGEHESGWDYDRMIAERNRGKPMSEIAREIGVSRNYVWHALGSQPRRRDTVVRQVRLNRRSWEQLPDICDRLGVRKITEDARPSNSVARLLDGIADGHLEVQWAKGASPDTVNIGIDTTS